jgi:hypothetical protein
METVDSQNPAATETSRVVGRSPLALFAYPPALYLLYLGARCTPLNGAYYHVKWAGLLSLTAGTLIWVFASLRGYWTSRAEQVLFYSLLTLPILWGSLLVLNAKADSSEPIGELTVIVQKHTGCWFLRSLCSYTLEVSSWQKERTIIRLDVGKEAFDQLESDQPVIVVTHAGWLGLTWARDIKTVEPWQVRAIMSQH